jgi:broad specificity phosphatase PhoE
MLILVRHAMPVVDPETDPGQWELSAEGHAAARALTLPPGALLVASAEPKARQTLEPSGQVMMDSRFNEIDREEAFAGDFRERRRSYVEGAAHSRWESQADVAGRFDEGIADWLAKAAGRPLVIGTHGMAMTVWLHSRIGLADPGAFWWALKLPQAFAIGLSPKSVTPL